MAEFKNDMRMNFETIFIPTRYSTNRKLSLEIKGWYEKNVSGCTSLGVKESVTGEEATAMYRSLIEHAPAKSNAREMRFLLEETSERIKLGLKKKIEKREDSFESYNLTY